MDKSELKNILEALLMFSEHPLTIESMLNVFEEWEKPSRVALKEALEKLANDYKGRAIELKCLASGYCFQTREQYKTWVSKQIIDKPGKYSRALLETLAIIAYKQPVTRADIEEIRGVAVSSTIIKTLQEREWVRIAGFKDVPGKPAIYVTTKLFLDYFNLKSLRELPELGAIEA